MQFMEVPRALFVIDGLTEYYVIHCYNNCRFLLCLKLILIMICLK